MDDRGMVMDDRLPNSILLEPPPETDLRELVAQLHSEVALLRGEPRANSSSSWIPRPARHRASCTRPSSPERTC